MSVLEKRFMAAAPPALPAASTSSAQPDRGSEPARLAVSRRGSGAPLVLLHALGSSRHSWDPVLPALAEHFEVVMVDLPGFGDSSPLPPSIAPTPAAMADAVAATLDLEGIRRPHVVGNSIGGWVALELSRLRPLASLTLLSPAGLWCGDTPRYCRISLRTTRWLAKHIPGVLERLVNHRLGRIIVLGQSHGRPGRISPDQARAAVRAMGRCAGFDATLAETIHRRYAARTPIDAPVTVAFGSRDRILLMPRWRRTDQLPTTTTVVELAGCGHLPMTDDPVAVAELIRVSTARATAPRSDAEDP